MPYLAKNWVKTATELRNLYALPALESSGLPTPQILQSHFFSDHRVDFFAHELGKQHLMNLYLDKLNLPLINANLWPLFGSEMVKFSPNFGGMVYFDGIKEVVNVGDDIKMAVMPFTDEKSNYKAFTGQFAPLFFTKDAYSRIGGLGVCFVNIGYKFSKSEIQGQIQLDKTTFKWLQKELKDRQRLPLPGCLQTDKFGAKKLSKTDIQIFDQNSEFYTMINMGGVALRLPRANGPEHEGEIYAIRVGDNDLLLIDELRVLWGYRERAFIQGFYQSKVSTELEENLGLTLTDFQQIDRQKIISNRLYDYSRPHLNLLKLENVKKISDLEKLVLSEMGMESLKVTRQSDQQTWDDLASNKISNPYTVYALLKLWLHEGKINLSKDAHYKSIVMEYRGLPSGEEVWTLPFVPLVSGQKISEITPDAGISRIVQSVNLVKPSELHPNHFYEAKPIVEVLKDISLGEYDICTVSAIFLALVRNGYIELNSPIQQYVKRN